MKNKFLLLLLLLFCAFESSENAICRFNYERVSFFKQEFSGYSCELTIETTLESDTITVIKGNHNYLKDDSDIKIMKKSVGLELSNFMFGFCKKFANLETLDMREAEIDTIEPKSLEKCSNLKQLSFEKNSIREFPSNTLFQCPSLTHFSLARNLLTSLNELSFVNQRRIEYLDLSYNKIKSLPSKLFESFSKLKILLLAKNNLKTLDENIFLNLYYLQQLNLNSNKISELPKNLFKPLQSLVNLRINENQLEIIHSDSFGIHNELNFIDLSSNKIKSIDEQLIQKTEISSFDIRENECCSQYLTHKSEMLKNLQNCFDNYKPRNREKKVFSCGKVKAGRQNIYGGNFVSQPGLFPWLALMTLLDEKMRCAGVIVSNFHLLTAAHCIQEKRSKIRVLAREILILLGVYDFNNKYDPNRITSRVNKVFIHPEWNPFIESFDADIAVLKLQNEIRFTNYIQPVCLLHIDSTLKETINGVVAGYGKSQNDNKIHENIPKVLLSPIHDDFECFSKTYDLAKLGSKRTFCAGPGDGTGVCIGDSGGGLYIESKNVFYLRGIVSSALLDRSLKCDVNAYSIYTDVTKFNDWIDSIIDS